MVQVKKEHVRARIIEAAEYLFSRDSYHRILISKIAKRAHVSPATIYTYFSSKFDLISQIYIPILLEQLDRIEHDAAQIQDAQERVIYVLQRFWLDCTRSNGLMSHNFIQALTLLDDRSDYSDKSKKLIEDKLYNALALTKTNTSLSASKIRSLMSLLLMTFDGFSINSTLKDFTEEENEAIRSLAILITR